MLEMYIDRFYSNVFDDDEINALCDGIENMLFKEFFEANSTVLSICCSEENDNELDNVIKIKHEADKDKENFGYNSFYYFFDDFYSLVFDYPVPQIATAALAYDEKSVFIYEITMKFKSGYVGLFVIAGNELDLEQACFGMYGLSLMICKILKRRDRSAKVLENTLRGYKNNMPESLKDTINKNVDRIIEKYL